MATPSAAHACARAPYSGRGWSLVPRWGAAPSSDRGNLQKGRSVYRGGRLRTHKGQDKDTGADRYSTESSPTRCRCWAATKPTDAEAAATTTRRVIDARQRDARRPSVTGTLTSRRRRAPVDACHKTCRLWATTSRSRTYRSRSIATLEVAFFVRSCAFLMDAL